jgi:hypothetical protein
VKSDFLLHSTPFLLAFLERFLPRPHTRARTPMRIKFLNLTRTEKNWIQAQPRALHAKRW